MELISREEVNKLLHNQREMQSRVNQLQTYDGCYLGSPCEYQNEDKKMPPQTEWIPVMERLPDKSGLYLLSIGDLVATFSFDGHTFYRGNIIVSPDAWMPLPKPYEEGAEK